jgi:hypothetical protein
MRPIIIFIALFLSAGVASAQSMLKVSVSDHEFINVSVDGRYFSKGGTSVTVGDLPRGRHYLEIFTMSQDRRGRMRENVIYEGPVRTYDGAVMLATFDIASGQLSMQSLPLNSDGTVPADPNYGNPQQGNMALDNGQNGNYQNNTYQNNNNYPDNSNNNNQNGNYQNNGNQDNTTYNNNSGAPVASPIAMGSLTDDKAAKLKSKVDAKATDTEKMKVLKDGLKGETYTTDQVATMMGWFIFESSKVSFAEWAYNSTVDKENFSTLDNKFSYKNSQDDLDKFLQGQR